MDPQYTPAPDPQPVPPVTPPVAPPAIVRPRNRWRGRLLVAGSVTAISALGLPIGLAVGSAVTGSSSASAASSSSTVQQAGYGLGSRNQGYQGSQGYQGYQGYGYSYGGTQGLGSGGTTGGSLGSGSSGSEGAQSGSEGANTSTATATQSQGLVDVTSDVDYGEATSAGTGMVLRSDGIVVTNHHVVAGATSIVVTVVSTGKKYAATVIGTDSVHDVAVLKLTGASGLTTVDTDSAALAKGDSVVSVGDANGDGGTLTAAPGTVTKLRKSITVQDDDGGSSHLANLIQVTSDVIPGDSGGALYDSAGDVVGMNVAASEGSQQTAGFVIPIARVLRVSNAILAGQSTGDITLGYDAFLGVELATNATAPVVSAVLQDGAAEKAGITGGDTITAVDGTAVSTATQLRSAVAALAPGQKVAVEWTTASGASKSATVTLGTAPVA